MRLTRFFVKDYGVLKNLEIIFHHRERGPAGRSYSLDVLVGLNGSGKSTVLKAIAEIFQNLERSTPVPFIFTLEYERRTTGGTIAISVSNQADDSGVRASEINVLVNGNTAQWSNDLLPEAIVAFTTGSEQMWISGARGSDRRAFQGVPEDWSLRELSGWIRMPDDDAADEFQSSRFRLVQNRELSVVTLCGLLDAMSNANDTRATALNSVLNYAGIRRAVGFALRFRVNSGLITNNELAIIESLGKLADRTLVLGADRLFTFNMAADTQQRSNAILGLFSGAFNLYRTLSNLVGRLEHMDRPLQDVSVFLTPHSFDEAKAPLHLFEWLSDGEQSLIGRMCLLTLLRGMDALALLDEPEVHFNDYWKRRMLEFLDQVMQGQQAHVIVTTHSSITLTDLLREDIVALQRTGAVTSDAANPTMATFGADPAEIMVQLFSSEYATGQRAVSIIQDALRDRPAEEQAEQARQLEELLTDVSPGYWSFKIKAAIKKLKA